MIPGPGGWPTGSSAVSGLPSRPAERAGAAGLLLGGRHRVRAAWIGALLERRRRVADVRPAEAVRVRPREPHRLVGVDPARALLLRLVGRQLGRVRRALQDLRHLGRRRRRATVTLPVGLDDERDEAGDMRRRHRRAVQRLVAPDSRNLGPGDHHQVLAAAGRVRRHRVDVHAGSRQRRPVEAEVERLTEAPVVVVGLDIVAVDDAVAIRVLRLARPAARGEHDHGVRLRGRCDADHVRVDALPRLSVLCSGPELPAAKTLRMPCVVGTLDRDVVGRLRIVVEAVAAAEAVARRDDPVETVQLLVGHVVVGGKDLSREQRRARRSPSRRAAWRAAPSRSCCGWLCVPPLA